MAWSFTIDARSVGLIQDITLGKIIGTTFSFIKPNWYVTAKHVILDYGQIREHLVVLLDGELPIRARVLFVHSELDLAMLEVERGVCERPLFPSHLLFADTNGLLAASYAPSKRHLNGAPCVYLTEIPTFELQIRERQNFNEETIVFIASESEGGHSGGPIFGAGGGVVGVIIENFRDDKHVLARGTNIIPLVENLTLVPTCD
ncbi:MAG TPA: trypsin-like peptidase domain-containing protein [Pyrinomonadaceae bacterium]|jgi:hypothetical protein